MRETDAILQSILYHHKNAKNVQDCIDAVEIMCNKENIDAVEAKIAAKKKEKEAGRQPTSGPA